MLRLREFTVAKVGTKVVLELEVGLGSPGVLAKVLVPGGDNERFDELVRLFGVAVHRPLHRTGTPARATDTL